MTQWIITSSILIAVVAALRFLLRGRITLRLQYALWGLVLLRLLVPVSFGSAAMSVMNAVPEAEPYENIKIQMGGTAAVYVDGEGTEYRLPEQERVYAERVGELTQSGENWYIKEHTHSVQLPPVYALVWMAGTLMVGVCLAVSNIRFSARLRKSRQKIDVSSCALPAYVSEIIDTPCLFGLFRPAVYVTPAVVGNETVFRHSIEHETTHYRHGDHIWALLRGVCLALHWYNPLVWLAAVLSRRDAELACDEATIKRIGENERTEYGRTLIGLTCQKRAALLLTATTMTGSKRGIKERITLIARKPKMAIYTLVAVLIIAAVAVGCTFTGARDKNGGFTSDASDVSQALASNDITVTVSADADEKIARTVSNYLTAETERRIEAGEIDGDSAINIDIAAITDQIPPISAECRFRSDSGDLHLFLIECEPDIFNGEGLFVWILENEEFGICQSRLITSEEIQAEYSTTQMLSKYGDMYTAACMELYNYAIETNSSPAGTNYTYLYEQFYDEKLAPLHADIRGISYIDLDFNSVPELLVFGPGASASGCCEIFTIENAVVCSFNTQGYVASYAEYAGVVTEPLLAPLSKHASIDSLNANMTSGDNSAAWEASKFLLCQEKESGEQCWMICSANGYDSGTWGTWYRFVNRDGALDTEVLMSYEWVGQWSYKSDGTDRWYIDGAEVTEAEYNSAIEIFNSTLAEKYELVPYYAEDDFKTEGGAAYSGDINRLIIDALNSDGAYAEGAAWMLMCSLTNFAPVETLEAVGDRPEGIRDDLCWVIANELKAPISQGLVDELPQTGLSAQAVEARDMIVYYASGDYAAPKSWRQVYLKFWDENYPALTEDAEIVAIGLLDTQVDGVPELAIWYDSSTDGVLYYNDGTEVYHNLGNIYEGLPPEGSDNVLLAQEGTEIDHDAMNSFLNSWRP